MFKLVSDDSCDLPEAVLKDNNIDIVHFYVSLDERKFLKVGEELSIQDFYKALESKDILPRTSLPSVGDYENGFRSILNEGKDIICFNISSKLSGSHHSALTAKDILCGEFPERKIFVVDSQQVSIGQGLLVLYAALLQKKGLSVEETYDKVLTKRFESKIVATVDSLDYLKRGGRIGMAASLASSMLKVKPIIFVENGELFPLSKVIGRGRAITELVNILKEKTNEDFNNYDIAVIHSDCEEEAKALEVRLANELGIKCCLPVTSIGITAGVHIGPTAIAIVFMKK